MFENIENKKIKVLIFVVLSAAIIMAVYYGLQFINKAKIILKADPPYTAEIYENRTECTENPCVINLGKGTYTVILQKEGYRQAEFDVTLGRGDEIEREIIFEMIPYVENIPASEGEEYLKNTATWQNDITLEKREGHKQALYTTSKSGEDVAIVYFNAEIIDPEIVLLNGQKELAVIEHEGDDAVYLVDIYEKSRKKLLTGGLTEISGLECSFDGKLCLVQSAQETGLVNTITGEFSENDELRIPLSNIAFEEEDGGSVFIVEPKGSGVHHIKKFDFEKGESKTILTTAEIGENEITAVKIFKNENGYELFMKTKEEYFVAKF